VRWLAALAAGVVVAISALPSATQDATARSAAQTSPQERTALRAGLQLAAMRSAIGAAPAFFAGSESGCGRTLPVIAYVGGSVLGGNFRDRDGACYVWINLANSPLLNAREICKVTLHEMGHLAGLTHVTDRADVMYSPFVAEPVPAPCMTALATAAGPR
jgi:hypothetical protein